MKTLSTYLAESDKEYNFLVKMAFEPTSAQLDAAEGALEKYVIKKIGSPKRVIRQSKHVDFPALSNVEVYQFDVSLKYPVTDMQLLNVVVAAMRVPGNHVHIRIPTHNFDEDAAHINDLEELRQMPSMERMESARLLKQDEKSKVNIDDYYGDAYNEKLVKDLKAASKGETDVTFAKKAEVDFDPDATKKAKGNPNSVLGTNKPKLATPPKK